MNYTNYLLKKDFIDIESLQTNNKYLKYPIIIISLPVSIFGIVTISGLIPITIVIDQYRTIKFLFIKNMRNKHIFIHKN